MLGGRAERIHAALFHAAGEHANAAHALVRIGALLVANALRIIACDRCTVAGRIGDRIDRTAAHDRAQRQRIQHRARLLRRTDVGLGARIGTATAVAGERRSAIGVDAALGLGGGQFATTTLDVRIAGSASGACALGLMLATLAEGRIAAGVRIADGPTDAVEPVAGLIVGAVLVVLADAGDAADERIALGADSTRAGGAMVLGMALGIVAALRGGIVGAWVQTFLVVARLVVGAFVVGLAFG